MYDFAPSSGRTLAPVIDGPMRYRSAWGSVNHPNQAPALNRTQPAAMNHVAHRRSVFLRPGLMNRHRWNRTTGNAIANPTYVATFKRSVNASMGEVKMSFPCVRSLR